MNNDNFTDAARTEAEKRWSRDLLDDRPLPGPARMNRRIGFDLGAQWARTYLAAQEPTDAEVPESVANLIRDLTDPDDCWFDHSGGCQAHGYLDLTPEQECPHSEAKRLLAARAARRDEGGKP